MSFSVGIVGLPNVGKSTLFKALTKKPVDIANYPFTTINPNIGVVAVLDQRLEKIAEITKPEKITPTIIEFVDIAGLVRGAHQGQGLGNQFLAQIRNCDAILEIVRAFKDPDVEHTTGEVDPEKDIEVIKTELLMKDLETIENIIPKIEKDSKGDKKFLKKIDLIKRVKIIISEGKLISEVNLNDEEKLEIKEYQFLTAKPILYILNSDGTVKDLKFEHLVMNLREEEEFSDFSENDFQELGIKSYLDQLITFCYNILDLITFYTIAGGKETRAWTVKKGALAPEAGGKVHSDFEDKFIKAEVIDWESLIRAESWHKARELGMIKTTGKDYIVEDGDVIEFKI